MFTNERPKPISAGDNDPRHGTENGYTNLRCRCDANAAARTPRPPGNCTQNGAGLLILTTRATAPTADIETTAAAATPARPRTVDTPATTLPAEPPRLDTTSLSRIIEITPHHPSKGKLMRCQQTDNNSNCSNPAQEATHVVRDSYERILTAACAVASVEPLDPTAPQETPDQSCAEAPLTPDTRITFESTVSYRLTLTPRGLAFELGIPIAEALAALAAPGTAAETSLTDQLRDSTLFDGYDDGPAVTWHRL